MERAFEAFMKWIVASISALVPLLRSATSSGPAPAIHSATPYGFAPAIPSGSAPAIQSAILNGFAPFGSISAKQTRIEGPNLNAFPELTLPSPLPTTDLVLDEFRLCLADKGKVVALGSTSVQVYSSIYEYALDQVFPSFIQELSGADPKHRSVLLKNCALMAYMGLHFFSEESEALRKELVMTFDRMLASNAGLKELEADGKLAQELLQEIKDLSSQLVAKGGELEANDKELM